MLQAHVVRAAWKDDEAIRVAAGHLAVAPDLMQINLPPLQSGKLRALIDTPDAVQAAPKSHTH